MVFLVAKIFCNKAMRSSIATIGALCLAASYAYHLSCLPTISDPPFALLILPVFLVWGFLAVVFRTKIIGFLTIAAYEAMSGFLIMAGPPYIVMGFEKDTAIPAAIISSRTLFNIYIIHSLHWYRLPQKIEAAITAFIPGVLFLDTFVYFLGLLIYSSEFFHSDINSNTICSNIVAIMSTKKVLQ